MKFKIFNDAGTLVESVETIQEAQSYCDTHRGTLYKAKMNKEENIQHIYWLCVNEELRPYCLTYSDVCKGSKTFTVEEYTMKKFLWRSYKKKTKREIPWYQYCIFNNEKEYLDWKHFCITIIKKHLRCSLSEAENEFAWLDLSIGIKQNYL